MPANCGNCGGLLEPDGPGRRARDDSHLHFSATCTGCGSKVQWHQTVIGTVGLSPLLGPARRCPAKCRHRDPAASDPARS
jgi:hypothetical protein